MVTRADVNRQTTLLAMRAGQLLRGEDAGKCMDGMRAAVGTLEYLHAKPASDADLRCAERDLLAIRERNRVEEPHFAEWCGAMAIRVHRLRGLHAATWDRLEKRLGRAPENDEVMDEIIKGPP